MKVEWQPSALDDRDAIIEYLEPLNPHAAANLDTRELAVWPYLIISEINQAADTCAFCASGMGRKTAKPAIPEVESQIILQQDSCNFQDLYLAAILQIYY